MMKLLIVQTYLRYFLSVGGAHLHRFGSRDATARTSTRFIPGYFGFQRRNLTFFGFNLLFHFQKLIFFR